MSCVTRKGQYLMGHDWDNHLVFPKLGSYWKRVTKPVHLPSLERCHSLLLAEGGSPGLCEGKGQGKEDGTLQVPLDISTQWFAHLRNIFPRPETNRTYLVTL